MFSKQFVEYFTKMRISSFSFLQESRTKKLWNHLVSPILLVIEKKKLLNLSLLIYTLFYKVHLMEPTFLSRNPKREATAIIPAGKKYMLSHCKVYVLPTEGLFMPVQAGRPLCTTREFFTRADC